MSKKKFLVVVDYQYDFFNPNGALYVNGGEKLQEKIEAIIPDFHHVTFTQDWHPLEHCSFVENGGQWPTHCVAGTIGAGIPLSMIKLAKTYGCCTKGEDWNLEEYGAFSEKNELATEIDYLFDFLDAASEFETLDEINDKVLASEFEIVVCGIAGDYCVLETLKNIVKLVGTDKVSVYLDGVVSIDGGVALANYMNENNIKVYK